MNLPSGLIGQVLRTISGNDICQNACPGQRFLMIPSDVHFREQRGLNCRGSCSRPWFLDDFEGTRFQERSHTPVFCANPINLPPRSIGRVFQMCRGSWFRRNVCPSQRFLMIPTKGINPQKVRVRHFAQTVEIYLPDGPDAPRWRNRKSGISQNLKT